MSPQLLRNGLCEKATSDPQEVYHSRVLSSSGAGKGYRRVHEHSYSGESGMARRMRSQLTVASVCAAPDECAVWARM